MERDKNKRIRREHTQKVFFIEITGIAPNLFQNKKLLYSRNFGGIILRFFLIGKVSLSTTARWVSGDKISLTSH